MTKLRFYLEKSRSKLWVRPVILSAAAVLWVCLSYGADAVIPEDMRVKIEKDTLINLFSILASSMLTVATFSVSAVATAFGSVANSASPRATSIVMGDTAVQSTLAAFLASFIYAVVSITALSAMNFGVGGRFMLFVGFVLLVSWVLVSFLHWVDRVSRLGKLDDTLERVKRAAKVAITNPELANLLGGAGQTDTERPEGGAGHDLHAAEFGYIQYVDMEELEEHARKLGARFWLDVRPGAYVPKGEIIGVVERQEAVPAETLEEIARCFKIDKVRSTSADPRFSMLLLSEVADRALSPAVNDPGTAIAVLAIQVELFHGWAETRQEARGMEVKYGSVHVPEIHAMDLVYDAFGSIARDGASMVEVGLRLQKTLSMIHRLGDRDLQAAVEEMRRVSLGFSDAALILDEQKKVVRDAGAGVLAAGRGR